MAEDELLERGHEKAVFEESLTRLGQGDGGVIVIEGVAGAGKTALVGELHRRAARAGIRVLAASGAEIEHGYPYAVVRQLFEPALRAMTPGQRDEVLAGSAAVAADLVGGGSAPLPGPGTDPAAMIHALYWVGANLAGPDALVITIDDAQWADDPSRTFLLYLARRLQGMSVLLAVAARPADTSPDLWWSELAAVDSATAIRPAAFSAAAVAQLVGDRLGPPDDEFVAAAHDATGGVPFFLTELISALAADGVPPTASEVVRVSDYAPARVASAIMRRLTSPPAAGPLAQAVAVLGTAATLPRAVHLAALDQAQALAAVDVLIARNVLRGPAPLEFVHPVIRAAVYSSMSAGTRWAAHAEAADLLADEGADPDVVAGQLLRAAPAGRADVAEYLRDAARRALERGAPESAAGYLRRALDEGVDRAARGDLLGRLGVVEKALSWPGAADTLREARRLTDDHHSRAVLGDELAGLLLQAGEWKQALDVLDADLEGLEEADPALAVRLRALWAYAVGYEPARHVELAEQMPLLLHQAGRVGPAGRPVRLLVAIQAAYSGESPQLVRGLVDQGLDGGLFLAAEGPESSGLSHAVGALTAIDSLDAASEVVDGFAAAARQKGSMRGTVYAAIYRVQVQTRRGDLVGAEADLRLALELGPMDPVALPTALWYAADAILERPTLDDVVEQIMAMTVPEPLVDTIVDAWLREVRGRLRHLAGDTDAAVCELREAGRMIGVFSQRGPMLTGWRRALVRILARLDPAAAMQLADEELADARRSLVPSWIGSALCTSAAAVATAQADAIKVLREATGVLATAPARYQYAVAVVDLGGALRRSGQRAEGRDVLREGLRLARLCGAVRLAERAEGELALAGARPRRDALSGVAALTAAELRVVRLAADGLTNRDIAQALFVNTNTVESHLYRAYPKLGIAGRTELADALRAAAG